MPNEQNKETLESLRKANALIHVATRRRMEKRDYYELFLMYLSGLSLSELADIRHMKEEKILEKVRFLRRRWEVLSNQLADLAVRKYAPKV